MTDSLHPDPCIIPWDINEEMIESENHKSALFFWIRTKSWGGLFWAETDPPSNFGGNVSSSFCVSLLINQPANQ